MGAKDCKLNLEISTDVLNKLFSELNNKNEVAGVITFDNEGSSKITKFSNGDNDSVTTPNHVINFHTHPVNAYNEANTVWGWPSGEDIRETMKFALAGNRAHIVFTVEGIYTIQVNKCKMNKMKKLLTDEERGVVVFLIEEYFKATHNFRGVSEVNGLSKKKEVINPYSYCDLCNHFDMGNLITGKNNTHTSLLKQKGGYSRFPNNGFLEFGNNKVHTKCIKDYIEIDDNLFKISGDGIDKGSFKMTNKQLLDSIIIINQKMGIKDCDLTWNNSSNKWLYVNFFPSTYYTNNEYYTNKYCKPKIGSIIVLQSNKPRIELFSNNIEGCSIEKLNENFKGFKKNINNNTQNTTFGKVEVTPQERYSLYQSITRMCNSFFNLEYLKKSNQGLSIPKLKNELSFLIRTGLLNYHGNDYIINSRIFKKK
jgi:hypothetical protein